ncbi:50S ribosomal protein L13 [Candidatus Pacearchaeota archaeon]|jgi:ribosomal protein uL13|nr:50S ribosomal protein L13 [Candidatus Pacearchaeota archaeon]|tara:strand:+ start:421 stop:825 length:405 start_codon:yes stop_codon:yes gene_type:complete
MSKIIIDGNGAVFGRICSFAAKRALEGNEIIVVNSEKTIMTGNKKDIIAKYSAIRKKGGHSQKGPKLSNVPHMILKRAIRGMLPDHRKGQGKETLKRIKCYDGMPDEFKDEKMIKVNAPKKLKFMELKELASKI